MNRRVIMMVLGMLWLAPLWAADATAWKEMSRDEQKVLQRFESRWEQLPAEQRDRLRKGAQRWEQKRSWPQPATAPASSASISARGPSPAARKRTSSSRPRPDGRFPPAIYEPLIVVTNGRVVTNRLY